MFGFLILLAGVARWLSVTAVVWLVGGVGVWLTGPSHTLHLGASVLAFGWLVYLLVRGVFSRRVSQVLLGLVLLVLYGGLLWGVLPDQPGVSWQGHLFGALGGAPRGVVVRRAGPRGAGDESRDRPRDATRALGPGRLGDTEVLCEGPAHRQRHARGRRPSRGGCVRR